MSDATPSRVIERLLNHPLARQVEADLQAEEAERRRRLFEELDELRGERQRHGEASRHELEPLEAEVERRKRALDEAQATFVERERSLMAKGIRLDQRIGAIEAKLRENPPPQVVDAEARLARSERDALQRFSYNDNPRPGKSWSNAPSVRAALETIRSARSEVRERLVVESDERMVARRCGDLVREASKAVASIRERR